MNGEKIYSVGFNRYIKEDTIQDKKIKYTIHAEIDALHKFDFKTLKGVDILIIRIGKTMKLKNSRPCNNCIDKLLRKGIRKVYYSDENGNIVEEFIDMMKKQHISSGNLVRHKNNILTC